MTQRDPSEPVTIRPISAFDLALLAELHAAIFDAPWDQPWSSQSFAEILAMPGAAGWLLTSGTTPLGFIVVRFIMDEGEILLTGVMPQARRSGHATRLMSAAMEAAGKAGIARLFLEHAAGNVAAGAFYDRFGFKPIGRRRAYYERHGGGREDAITLACTLQAAERAEKSGKTD